MKCLSHVGTASYFFFSKKRNDVVYVDPVPTACRRHKDLPLTERDEEPVSLSTEIAIGPL